MLDLIQAFPLDVRSGRGSPEGLSIKKGLVDEMLSLPEIEQMMQRKCQRLLEEIGEQVRMRG